MSSAEEQVRAKWKDAVLDEFECDEGCKHFRILGPRKDMGREVTMYQDSPDDAWADAAHRLEGMNGD